MSKLSPVEKSKYINEQYKEYLRSSFHMGSDEIQNLFEKQLEVEELFKGPYVDLNLPFKRGKNIDELIDEGIVCKSFRKLGDVDFTRPLYLHQEEAIRKICSGHSAVVTTGTGSGKTECFLYPILNDILKDIENGVKNAGIRALFLYPMNALVNDQIDRVRKMLKNCPEITYGFFTGDTPEKVGNNYREKLAEESETAIPDNELLSREEMRENPPYLLFTNYSMLEYLLIRPNDYSIFYEDNLYNWKYVVMDEAHTYRGSLGIELSMLMRRVTGMAPQKPRFILTSATLGEKGKSEDAIIQFARNLTSAYFDVNDIIFSKRFLIENKNDTYYMDGEDYTKIKKSIDNPEIVRGIAEKYKKYTVNNVKETLYDLLISDQNVIDIYNLLKNGCKDFKTIYEQFKDRLTEKQLTDLIDIINMSEKNGIGIFDLKYHSFVRPISGAYLTLGKNHKFSLTKTNAINGERAFEIGNCRYCNVPYIIGKVIRNSVDNIDYLVQNKEIDIYENYGDNQFVALDYFLLDNKINDEEVDINILQEDKVCSICGAIYPADNINARKCNCGDDYKYSIYKVLHEKEDDASNNISQCPCCGRKSLKGIVKNLNLGKDEGTALVAQILYEAIDEGKESKKSIEKLSLKKIQKQDKSEENIKQFLTFSDSRQQASFSAVFFDASQTRILQKRIIWEIIKNNDFRDISVNEMASILTSYIKERDLFANKLGPEKNAWVALMRELLLVDGANGAEGLGLFHFDLDLSDIMNQIDEDDVNEEFGKYGITKKDLETIMQVVLRVFKVTPAISYVNSGLTREEKQDYLEFRSFDNYIMYNSEKTVAGVRSFMPVKGKSNSVVRYVQKVANCNEEEAKDILDVIFNNLAIQGELLKKHDTKEQYQISAGKYVIKNYKTSKYYRCSKCYRLTPYNAHNVCVYDKCNGKISEVEPDVALVSNYYRRQYKTKKIERIVIEEHTAQIERKTAKRYQQDFKNKKINILSCSTTFEMGIDIGGLETVFMRNIPPTPANYVQRAGRAGRRKDSSAYILTYCGTGSHDYTYFCEPERMISGLINPPSFNVVNDKIIVRHLMAVCLGSFFRKYQEYFKSIDGLVFGDGALKFKQYIASHPTELNDYIDDKVLPEDTYIQYHDFMWFDKIGGDDEKLNNFIEKMKSIAEEYEKAKKEAINNEKYNEAYYYTRQLEELHKGSVIESLSRYCVIPKYGFPVDLVELQTYIEGKLDTRCDLSRDLKVAISEYAPDSEVVADHKKYTSKYITLPKTSEFPRHYYVLCPTCRKMNVYLSTYTGNECRYCGEPLGAENTSFYIEPVYGFKTGITKESISLKPKRSYSGEVSYLGGGKKDDIQVEIKDKIIVESSANDELLVVNKSVFYMCPVCGYSDITKNNILSPVMAKKHKNYRQFECTCEELERVKLGHSFRTDVVRFTIPMLEASCNEDYDRALSFLYAFLEGISNTLEIERNDIDGIVEYNLEKHSYDILIYDNVSGGAGHSKRLMNKQAVVSSLIAAHDKVSQKCCDENTSCYNCIRNYYNQTYHSVLKRKLAKNFIEELLREID